jgi:hypothetical protein
MIAARIPRQVGQLARSALAVLLIMTPGLAADDSNEAWAALVKGGHRCGDPPWQRAARLWR